MSTSHQEFNSSNQYLLRSFTGTWWSRVDDKKVKIKKADIPWFMQKTNKALDTGLASLMKALGTLSGG